MSIEMRPGSGFFYARVRIRGQKKAIRLKSRVQGLAPARMTDEGDAAFERSRGEAMAEERNLRAKLKERHRDAEDLKRVVELRSGRDVASILITGLFAQWRSAPSAKPRSERYEDQVEATFERFEVFLSRAYPHVTEAIDVTHDIATEFMPEEDARGIVSCKHVRGHLSSVFGWLVASKKIPANPFAQLPIQKGEVIHRQPYSIEELSRILDAVQPDELLRPLVTTAACTAMRLGDCCLLRLVCVNRKLRTILVPALQKTGRPAVLPIARLLWKEIERAADQQKEDAAGESPYVFPDLARAYQVNPKWLSSRFERLLKRLGFDESQDVSKSIRIKREKGLRKASLRGFHSFKTTWVTIALCNGIPMEIVQRVTGNEITQIVIEHYFNPQADEIRRQLAARLPALLSVEVDLAPGLERSQICDRLRTMSDGNWRSVRDELVSSLEKEQTLASAG